ncbi:3'(2'),5'-bisphosphate nucleotidase CysQ [Salinicola aestuarinus]|uniref:3'(2'),5'-bisphosphate nucleotidase CysQ n=1 Tax=Salinicola aestuarinus TaxID=1949082 RepID=UPI001CB717B2|nr:3'(2'),5'-bisphosphate nucleotidase CysQ [Salinicola aestuarinus]
MLHHQDEVIAASLGSLSSAVVALCRQAGDAIEEVAHSQLRTQIKDDDSPVTTADFAAHSCLVEGLTRLGVPGWPVLSEESASVPWQTRRQWSTYWLIDPLDGTKEYLRGSDEYSVNVALIHDHRPILGVVEKPRTREVWLGRPSEGAWHQAAPGANWSPLSVAPAEPPRVVVSRFHRGAKAQRLIDAIPGVRVTTLGSSLKCCLIAGGRADLYPRFGPTSEWDTAAAQAVLEGAGGSLVETHDWSPLRYNTKASLLNPGFVACASLEGAWRKAW